GIEIDRPLKLRLRLDWLGEIVQVHHAQGVVVERRGRIQAGGLLKRGQAERHALVAQMAQPLLVGGASTQALHLLILGRGAAGESERRAEREKAEGPPSP